MLCCQDSVLSLEEKVKVVNVLENYGKITKPSMKDLNITKSMKNLNIDNNTLLRCSSFNFFSRSARLSTEDDVLDVELDASAPSSRASFEESFLRGSVAVS